MKHFGDLHFGNRNWKVSASQEADSGKVREMELHYGNILCHKVTPEECTTPLLSAALAVAEAGIFLAGGLIDTGKCA